MSLDELKERIKDEVVLREGDLFDWQWRQLGLVAEAEELGVPESEFLAVVNDVSRAINPYFGRISDLKIKVADLARLQRKKLTDPQINQIVAEATRLQLLPDFVRERWIPAILSTLPEPAPLPEEPVRTEPVVVPTNETSKPQPVLTPSSPPVPPVNVTATPPVAALGIDREAVARKVRQFLDEYVADKLIPARVLKPLFLATNFDETVLADAVLSYLSANFYAAETAVKGESLKDKLLSTDWRHLSWWYSTAVPTPALTVIQPARPAQRKSSDFNVIGMAMIAVALLIGAVWWITMGRSTTVPPAEKPAVVQHTDSVPATPLKKKTRRKLRSGKN